MSANTSNIPNEIWLIGAISAWDKLEMTAISFPFSFSITLHEKSHFLACLLIMNCAVLCPTGPFPPRGQKPPQRNNVDVSRTDGELTLIKKWEIHFQRKEAACGDKTLKYGAKGTALHKGVACARISALPFIYLNRQICVQTLMS